MKNKWDDSLLSTNKNETLWELFHVNSRCSHFSFTNIKHEHTKKIEKAEITPYINYPAISLPNINKELNMPLVSAIKNRTSKQNMVPGQFNLEDIANLLLSSYSLKDHHYSRHAPSAGALYPIEIYFHFSGQKSDIDPALYYYNPLQKELRQLTNKNCNTQVQNILMQPELVENSSLQIFLTAVFSRSTKKYSDRGYRFAFLEAGHIAQNINLIATAMNLASINIGGYYEEEANKFLKIDGLYQSVIYMVLVGNHS